MTTADLYLALLRPAIIQILRATGFSYARPSAVDSLTDLAARYLLLLSSSTAQIAFSSHNDYVPTIQDIRLAMTDRGALRPQMSSVEESARGFEEHDGQWLPFEDLRGVSNFVDWAQGSINKEIRRVAGLGDEIDVNEIAAGFDESEDYLTALKKKHSKTGEVSRYQGTLLGKEADTQPVLIAGGEVTSILEWGNSRSRTISPAERSESPDTSMLSSAPMTPAEADAETDAAA